MYIYILEHPCIFCLPLSLPHPSLLLSSSPKMFLAVRGGAHCLHHHRDLQLWGEHTHTASSFSDLWSPESWQSRGGCEWCQCLGLWFMLWMSLCWDYQRLGMATQWKCYDWPHALPDCVLIGCDTRILRLELRQSAGFVVSGKYYRAYILIKGGDFIVPSNLHDQLRLAPHKHRSAVVCELGNITVDLSL